MRHSPFCAHAGAVLMCLLLLAAPATAQPQNGLPESPQLRVQLKPVLMTTLSSQSPGKILNIDVADGESFHAGQELVRLDCALPEAQRARARAVKSRKDRVLEVTAKLHALGSRSDLELEVAKAEAAEAAADLRLSEVQVSRCVIPAPFDGRASEVFVKAFQFVDEGQPILEILSDKDLEIEFVAPSSWMNLFKPGYEFSVAIHETGSLVTASVIRIGGKVDPVSQSVKVFARLVGDRTGLMPGMSGEGRIDAPK